ncbi:hypothetical protein [Metaplanococcus flavidus]|uniref:Uncharacterized protein n=1 Tax=Metaplanococcus flavidus TaxID=569883 RepID=A0ABW3LFZ0_9BACL
MKLPAGVSGFYKSDEQKPPEIDVGKYKELCYGIARNLEGDLLEFSDTLYPANFFKADFRLPDMNICLVMNKHYPIVAFATAVEDLKIKFIDYSTGTDVVPEEFTVLSAEILEAPVPEDPNDLPESNLNKGEIEQIKYWKPDTVGQIIFNFWD